MYLIGCGRVNRTPISEFRARRISHYTDAAIFGAGCGNRIRVSSMASWHNNHYTNPALSEQVKGIEPSSFHIGSVMP